MPTERKTTPRRRTRGRRRKAPGPGARPAGVPEPPPLAPAAAPEEMTSDRRRAVFFDVENSSRAEHLAAMLEHLGLQAIARETQLMAVGNWRVIGQESAHLLARHGAALIHSAPAFGVKDWSDLRIAVAAGVWLGTARPADVLEIVSDDQAFDAVGDVSASVGVVFRRLSFRSLIGAGVIPQRESTGARPRRRTRGGRRVAGGGAPRRGTHATVASPAPPAARHPRAGDSDGGMPATEDQIVDVARSLVATAADGTILLDALANALKSRGFQRPPGSLRLITRLRKIAALDVSARGVIRLAPAPDAR